MKTFGQHLIDFSNLIWGTPLLVLLLGGGLFFLIYSRLIPFRYIRHAIQILSGRYDDPGEPGQINHYQALSTALSGTVGMGNVSGVAVAITTGGPGAIFWMWISALLGVATKYFTCSLAVMYRGKDSAGELQGGPMYFITEGLGKNWKPLAIFFSLAGMIGVSPIFQANQLTQVIADVILAPNGIETGFHTKLIIGVIITILVSLVVFGGIKRIGKVAGKLVPLMVILYIVAVLFIIFSRPLHTHSQCHRFCSNFPFRLPLLRSKMFRICFRSPVQDHLQHSVRALHKLRNGRDAPGGHQCI